jgi:hypothetical protein
MLDTCLDGFLDDILDDRLVDHRHHFLRHRLGGRKKPGAQARDRKHSLFYLANRHYISLFASEIVMAARTNTRVPITF